MINFGNYKIHSFEYIMSEGRSSDVPAEGADAACSSEPHQHMMVKLSEIDDAGPPQLMFLTEKPDGEWVVVQPYTDTANEGLQLEWYLGRLGDTQTMPDGTQGFALDPRKLIAALAGGNLSPQLADKLFGKSEDNRDEGPNVGLYL